MRYDFLGRDHEARVLGQAVKINREFLPQVKQPLNPELKVRRSVFPWVNHSRNEKEVQLSTRQNRRHTL
jgi:hypothetical protein